MRIMGDIMNMSRARFKEGTCLEQDSRESHWANDTVL